MAWNPFKRQRPPAAAFPRPASLMEDPQTYMLSMFQVIESHIIDAGNGDNPRIGRDLGAFRAIYKMSGVPEPQGLVKKYLASRLSVEDAALLFLDGTVTTFKSLMEQRSNLASDPSFRVPLAELEEVVDNMFRRHIERSLTPSILPRNGKLARPMDKFMKEPDPKPEPDKTASIVTEAATMELLHAFVGKDLPHDNRVRSAVEQTNKEGGNAHDAVVFYVCHSMIETALNLMDTSGFARADTRYTFTAQWVAALMDILTGSDGPHRKAWLNHSKALSDYDHRITVHLYRSGVMDGEASFTLSR